MDFGSMPNDGGGLLINASDYNALLEQEPELEEFVLPFIGSRDAIHGQRRYCIWIPDGRAQFPRGEAHLRRGHKRGHHQLHPGQAGDRARPVRPRGGA
ncbi:MAG: type IIL restriction-modification enzyme MmeI [Alphaproteobacteria bacterium]